MSLSSGGVKLTKKILYGKSNFEAIIQNNGYYVDKTRFIEKLENLGADFLLFLRPRRFGKSLFLSTLEYYYDINQAEQFDKLFGKLYIGKKCQDYIQLKLSSLHDSSIH